MTPTWLRIGTEAEDREKIEQWIKNMPHLDEQWRDYTFLAAERKDKVLGYMPLKQVAMMETLALNPDCTPQEHATALRELVVGAQLTAQAAGCKELVFWDTNEGTTRGATLMGFSECPWKLYRLRR